RRKVRIGRIIALEIIANALRITLTTTIEVQHPAMCDRIGHHIPMKSPFDLVNDVGHQCLRNANAQKPTIRPKPTTTTASKMTMVMPKTFNTSLSPSFLGRLFSSFSSGIVLELIRGQRRRKG